jgi:hypothetical protein
MTAEIINATSRRSGVPGWRRDFFPYFAFSGIAPQGVDDDNRAHVRSPPERTVGLEKT